MTFDGEKIDVMHYFLANQCMASILKPLSFKQHGLSVPPSSLEQPFDNTTVF